jgi:hypothetical protein
LSEEEGIFSPADFYACLKCYAGAAPGELDEEVSPYCACTPPFDAKENAACFEAAFSLVSIFFDFEDRNQLPDFESILMP